MPRNAVIDWAAVAAEYRPAISRHNTKLGPGVASWSIPALHTCPCATPACISVCYAARGNFAWQSVREAHARNEAFSRQPAFVPWMLHTLRAQRVAVLRKHAAGDYYDAEYTQKWAEIVRKSPQTQFFAYTRSWDHGDIFPVLKKLAKLPNIQLWFSQDVDTGTPPYVAGVRVAWMARTDEEAALVPSTTHLVFRDKPKTTMKKSNGVQVCPYETHIPNTPKIGCSICQICFKPPPANNAVMPEGPSLVKFAHIRPASPD